MSSSSKPFAQANIQAHLQVLSVGAAEASPTCLVITDRDRFMLNVGEGTQRLAMEHKVRLTRFDHLFLTTLTPEALGGLPGMLLTMADCGKTAISIHGPVGLRALLRATSHFMRRDDLKIIIREYGTTGLAMQGPTLAMHALPLLPTASASAPATEQEPPQPPPEQQQEQQQQEQNGNEPTAKRPRAATASPTPSTSPSPCVAWVGQTASVLGKFDVRRAKELGIPTGPLFGKLKAGQAVTLPDGRIIQAEEVVAPPTPGAIFGIMHLPDGEREGKEEGGNGGSSPSSLLALPPPTAWLEAALGTAAAATAEGRHLTCLVHYTSAALVHTPLYQEWMKSFGPSTTHILAALPLGAHQSPYRAARLNNLRLHLLDAVIFPRAAAPSLPTAFLSLGGGWKERVGEEGKEEKMNVVWGKNLMKYQLLPENKKGADESGVLGEVAEAEEEELRNDAEIRQVVLPPLLTAEEEEREEEEEKEGGKEEEEEVEIVFLGTGSAVPSKYRNVSGIYLRIGGSGRRRRRRRRREGGNGEEAQEEDTAKGMLLDVGEGSLGQLAALYEGEALSHVLVNLKAIWISHPHADHHLGLMKVLVARRQAAARLSLPGGEPPSLLVLVPRPLLAWLREFRKFDPAVRWYCNDEGGKEGGKAGGEEEEYLVDVERMSPFAYAFLKQELGLLNLTNVVVHHCPFAFGVVLDGVADWRLVYSGDTRPCQRLVQAGKGATILIHEATFESGKAAEAVERKHSTVDEALDIARRMEAKTVILTHFSQRYPKFPVLPSGSELRVCVAFDLMTLRFRDVDRAAALLPMLQKLFPAEEEEGGEEEVLGVVGSGGGPK